MSARPQAVAAVLLMVIAIATAWSFQIFGGFEPCPLCLEQRVPYYAAIPLALLAIAFLPGLGARAVLLLASAAMLYSAALGVYQAGAEWEFWAGPDACAGGTETVRDAGNLLAAIENAAVVSCTEVQGRVLGLSFAGWNVVAAGTAALLLLSAAFAPRQP